jgi:hypothetical protein
LGLDRFTVEGASRVVLEWYEGEREEPVREILLEHMARESSVADYALEVVDAFKGAPVNGHFRGRLLAAAQGRPLYSQLQRQIAVEGMARAGMSRDLLGGDLFMGSKFEIGGDNNGFVAGGDQNAQNMVAGDMIGSANGAVQTLANDKSNQKEVLETILRVLSENKGFKDGASDAVATAVADIAKDPSPKNKMTLFGTLKALVSGVSLAASLVEDVDKLADTVMEIF